MFFANLKNGLNFYSVSLGKILNILGLNNLVSLFSSNNQFVKLKKWADKYEGNLNVTGTEGSLRSILFASFYKNVQKRVLLVLEDSESAGYFYHDLDQLLGKNSNLFFFPSSYRSAKVNRVDAANEILRTEALTAINSPDSHFIVVTYPDALVEPVVKKAELLKNIIHLCKGDFADLTVIEQLLLENGFSRVDFVYEPGQFSVRGSLIDVFSFSSEYPYRIDFFGDEVDSIRTFDVESQLSKEIKESLDIVPNLHETDNEELFLDSLPDNVILGFSNYRLIYDHLTSLLEEKSDSEELYSAFLLKDKLDGFRKINLSKNPYWNDAETIEFSSSLQPAFNKNFDLVSENLIQLQADGYSICFLSDNEHQLQRLNSIFSDRGDTFAYSTINKTLHEGFISHDLKLACYTDHQIFNRYHKYSLRSDRARAGQVALTLKELNSFKMGDYVVHIDHGVARFGGLIQIDANGKKQEVIKLLYKNDDLLLVSIHSLHKISRYKSKEGEAPTISKLGTSAWQNMKERTKKRLKDIARDLILLYAKRREERGFAFSPDGFLQSELEASFIYEDTPDQLKTTLDVKRDMERDLPMDRLICGDVGFGKTEIAVRAAFKAVCDNKQVAVLVPTTVLAFQHYKTFTERLKDFPCKVDYLNRARSSKDVKRVLEELESGEVNIIIGTQKILGKNMKFKDLGLLVIDEEQKFGVAVKEKIKQMKVNVDTLTMTATPIPRTLQFSLMGARDLSVISTPPPNRYPVQTEVLTFDREVIREAISFEMDRNGQVFFVNNNVKELDGLALLIRQLVPGVRVAIGHGQMEGEKLEQIMMDFVNQEYDVLLATTIIESGIDISNCNTIIINRAQNFGLSDLHQLRGRVGRSNRRAFCYLMVDSAVAMTKEAQRRLQAIESFSELGSGFNIAMQDLDIRGAGNLLGAEQSGFIADLGYEAYQKVLNAAVEELKEQEFSYLFKEEDNVRIEEKKYVSECVVETDMELTFPPEYIESVSERMSLYRELDNVKSEQELGAFEVRLIDRFGKLPIQTKNLLNLVRIRWRAERLGFEKLVLKQNRMVGYFVQDENSVYYQSPAFGAILDYMQNHAIRCQLREKGGKRSILFIDVEDVDSAYNILLNIML